MGAVVEHWLGLPEGSRPRLVLHGESLGYHGIEVGDAYRATSRRSRQ
jgi:uncharacterized membrane protein